MTSVIETQGLTKDYGNWRGLFDLDLTVPSGEVFGFLGPNGAGKTTTIRLLMGMIRPTRGSAAVFGLDCWKQSVDVKRKVGYVPGEMPQFGGLRGSEVVAYIAGLRRGVDVHVVSELTTRFDLDLGQRFREYSRGNKQKLGLVLAFMHRPDLLILDEPTGGLDPLNQQEFYRLVAETRDRGATTFLSSHILSEVEHICTRVGIVRQGHLVRVASLADLHHLRVHEVEIEFADKPPAELMRSIEGVDVKQIDGRRVRLTVRGSFAPLMDALAGHHVLTIVSHEPSLEEVFLSYYGSAEPEPVAS
ncbi:MAG TPA: ABC transporter ATP-binding protein [Chloroflexota bacterium]